MSGADRVIRGEPLRLRGHSLSSMPTLIQVAEDRALDNRHAEVERARGPTRRPCGVGRASLRPLYTKLRRINAMIELMRRGLPGADDPTVGSA